MEKIFLVIDTTCDVFSGEVCVNVSPCASMDKAKEEMAKLVKKFKELIIEEYDPEDIEEMTEEDTDTSYKFSYGVHGEVSITIEELDIIR
jgi:hypothetical protein